jgi:hypothetical protein
MRDTPNRKPYQLLAWIGTLMLIVGASMTALNIYPLNVWVMIVANGVWLIAGWLWNEPSVIGLNLAMVLIYILGAINLFI